MIGLSPEDFLTRFAHKNWGATAFLGRRVMFKNRKILGRRSIWGGAVFFLGGGGVFETGDPRIKHVNSYFAFAGFTGNCHGICWEARILGHTLTGEPLCRQINLKNGNYSGNALTRTMYRPRVT